MMIPPALEPGMPLLSPSLQKDFDVDVFLCSRVPGQDVQAIVQELRTYQQTLQTSLVHAVHDKYPDFLSLAKSVQGESGAIHALKDTGLSNVLASLDSLRFEFERHESELIRALQEEHDDAMERRRLTKLMNIEHVLSQLERMADGVSPLEAPLPRVSLAALAGLSLDDESAEVSPLMEMPPQLLEERMRQQLHAYTWLQHLLGRADHAADQSFLLGIEPRLVNAYSRICDDTQQLHIQVLRSVPPGTPIPAEQRPALELVLNIALELGEPTVRSAMKRQQQERVLPVIQACFDDKAPTGTPTLTPGLYSDASEIAQLADLTHLAWGEPVSPNRTQRLCDLCNALLDAARSLQTEFELSEHIGGAAMDLFNDHVWRTMAEMMMERHGARLFFIGKPDEFHANYAVVQAWMSAVERLAPSPKARAAFRQHATTLALERRWQLSAFFHLRAKDTVLDLELALRGPPVAQGADGGFFHAGFPSLLRAFVLPWRRTRHIHTLSAREWRLSLHVLSRYKTWLTSLFPPDEPPASDSGAPSRSATPGPADDAGLTPGEVQLLEHYMGLVVDARLWEERVSRVYHDWLRPKWAESLDSASEGLHALVEAMDVAMDASLGMAATAESAVSAWVVRLLRRRCAEPLRHVRAANSQFHTGSRPASPAPSPRPSEFVAAVVRPLYELARPDGPATRLPAPLVQSWVDAVLSHTLARYASALDTVQRNLESLRRLRRGTSLARSEAVPEDSVNAQLSTDVEALAREVEALARRLSLSYSCDGPAWAALRQALQRT